GHHGRAPKDGLHRGAHPRAQGGAGSPRGLPGLQLPARGEEGRWEEGWHKGRARPAPPGGPGALASDLGWTSRRRSLSGRGRRLHSLPEGASVGGPMKPAFRSAHWVCARCGLDVPKLIPHFCEEEPLTYESGILRLLGSITVAVALGALIMQ